VPGGLIRFQEPAALRSLQAEPAPAAFPDSAIYHLRGVEQFDCGSIAGLNRAAIGA